jgi:hypothetical protein
VAITIALRMTASQTVDLRNNLQQSIGHAMTHLRLQKSIYLILQWGWRGPAVLAVAVLGLWLYHLWTY